MRTLLEHIDHVKEQPHHVRKQVVLASAASLTAVIALVWFAGSLATGAFSIQGGTLAGDTESQGASVGGVQNLAGVGAAAALSQVEDTPARIEIVDTSLKSSKQKQAEQTVIPF